MQEGNKLPRKVVKATQALFLKTFVLGLRTLSFDISEGLIGNVRLGRKALPVI